MKDFLLFIYIWLLGIIIGILLTANFIADTEIRKQLCKDVTTSAN